MEENDRLKRLKYNKCNSMLIILNLANSNSRALWPINSFTKMSPNIAK